MATFQLFFQSGRAKDLSAPLYRLFATTGSQLKICNLSGEILKILKCYNFMCVQRRHNCSPAASFTNCVMTLYMLKVRLQTFRSIPITQKCQILSCDACCKWAICPQNSFRSGALTFVRSQSLRLYLWGHLETTVNSAAIEKAGSFHQRIDDACQTICDRPGTFERVWQSTIRRVQACIHSGGGYFEHSSLAPTHAHLLKHYTKHI